MPGPVSKSAPHLVLLPLIALLATVPLLVHGPSCGHDFDFHLLSWFEAATQIAHGNLHPHWAYTPAWNAGEPRFVFYPPISWYLGALLGLILPWTWAPSVYTWISLSAAGLACHRLLRVFAPPATALLVSALYIVNPYMLFTAYERTAYAELLCAAWLPLLLLGILRPKPAILGIALPLALLWLTNAPAAVLGTYSLALLAATRLAIIAVPQLRRSLTVSHVADKAQEPYLCYGPTTQSVSSNSLALTTFAGTALGLGLAAFYIVPAAYQRRFVEIALVNAPGMSFSDNFLFAHTADQAHDAVLHTASIIAVTLLAIAVFALIAAFVRKKLARPPLPPLAILIAVIALLLTPFSTFIWLHAPQLAFLQFPWRFLAILTPVLALILALVTHSGTLHRASKSWSARHTLPVVFLASFVLVASSVRPFFQPCDDEDTPAARLALFHSSIGTDPTDEYTPNTEDESSLSHTNPPYWLADTPETSTPANATPGPLHTPLTLTAPTPEVLILNLRDYPAWQLFLNHHLVTERLARPDGLIAIPLPAGRSTLTLAYARTPDQTTGEIVSVISLAALLYLLYRRRRR